MRVNKFVAQATGLSRRAADAAISEGRVTINQKPALPGDSVDTTAEVTLDGKALELPAESITIMLNKPAGYVCSRDGQGSQTIYDLLPAELHQLKSIGRLDKDTSGLLLLTNDGGLANNLTHPRYSKQKVYQATLDKPLSATDQAQLEKGVELEDGPSKLKIDDAGGRTLTITMSEGRNRQIRRTFAALGYKVLSLNRTHFGPYSLSQLAPTQRYKLLD